MYAVNKAGLKWAAGNKATVYRYMWPCKVVVGLMKKLPSPLISEIAVTALVDKAQLYFRLFCVNRQSHVLESDDS